MNDVPLFQKRLQVELENRKKKNPRYSARAFARTLDIDVAAISRILSGKQIPSLSLSEKISRKLGFSELARREFIASVIQAQIDELTQKLERYLDHI
jgi:transcriptional regulator with XRE-family HTH domain